MDLDANKMLYARTHRRVENLMKVCACAVSPAPVRYVIAFLVVAYDVCVGQYSIDSWFFDSNLW